MLCPFGMMETFTKRLDTKRSYSSFAVLSPKVVETLKIDEENYDVTQMSLTVGNIGDLGTKEFTHISCKVCKKDFIPQLMFEHRESLPENPSLIDLLEKWDKLKIPQTLLDLAGCFFPNEKHITAGPNGKRFIQRPCLHPPVHAKIKVTNGIPESSTSSRQDNNQCTKGSSAPKTKVLVQKKIAPKPSKEVTLKNNLSVKMKPISEALDQAIDLSQPCKDDVDKWAKRFLLKTLRTGVNKTVSNEASLEFYDSVIDGCKDYHKTVLKNVVVNDQIIPPPPKVRVNRNNISIPQKSILTAIQESLEKNNPYNIFTHQSDYYSIMHDGIQKFRMELNGVILRTIDTDLEVLNIPWMLKEIPGGSLNADKLVIHVMNVIGSIRLRKLPNDSAANYRVSDILLKTGDGLSIPKPPFYFSSCSLLHFDLENKVISLDMPDWPVAINGDGCSTNTSAGTKLVERFGLLSPNMRCVVHAGIAI